MNNPNPNQQVITTEMFGHPTDFLFETKRDDAAATMTITLTTVLPKLTFADGVVTSHRPPRYPWPFF